MKKQMGPSGADLELDRKYRVLKGVPSFGGKPRTMSISVGEKKAPKSSSTAQALSSSLNAAEEDEQKGTGSAHEASASNLSASPQRGQKN